MSTDANQDTIRAAVLRDAGGGYYVLPLDLIQQGRVPAEHIPAFEQMLAEQGDVQGFLGRGVPLPPPLVPKLPQTGGGGIKPIESVPPATLLLPYFEVNLSKGAFGTLFG